LRSVIVDDIPKEELTDLGQTIQEAGLAARTLLIFKWTVPGNRRRVLKDDILQDAVDIENVARGLLDDEPSRKKDKGKSVVDKGKSIVTNDKSSGVKLPKWMSKLSKK
jgi:hypothetical protein